MGQWSNEGSLCAHPKTKRRVILARTVLECEGKLIHVAFTLGYHRSHIYRLVDEYRLWPVVNRVRIERLQRESRERSKGV